MLSLDAVEALAASIEARGYAIVTRFVDTDVVESLGTRVAALEAAGALRPAGVGRGDARIVDDAVRGDRIAWLDAAAATPAERTLHDALEWVRTALNRRLALGLFSFEGHYALYRPGAGYAPHRDRFRDDDTRVVSCVLYLNADWQPETGGALRLYIDVATALDVLPHGGTLVAFLSERFVHEVRPATRARASVTGWFRRRARIDAP
jgi:SM-20-related protein